MTRNENNNAINADLGLTGDVSKIRVFGGASYPQFAITYTLQAIDKVQNKTYNMSKKSNTDNLVTTRLPDKELNN